MIQRLLAVTVLSLALGGCAASSPPPLGSAPFSTLAGTSWQLVEIQSMQDGAGRASPSDPRKYTMTFDTNGTLSARLDCNRATATWRNEIANTTGGTLTFGPIAVTKALCPEPTLGETLERQLPFVRSFTIRDDRLNMALMADGGIIVWEPVKTLK